ncbi:hypothetical protein C7974DRAFT_455098 [Boeremia exigua]|uniref:uncharacterized protein n=1 Tax=Boeremia exigua TaxID=749465 RepID=UPI001E8CD14D|nr:uncharacterized protein C7974DRAFT_455098 [Boeremia exigua]KAH6625188.1 hypothetical protein C7974DRAFT_455098 [Boeremia exigua]
MAQPSFWYGFCTAILTLAAITLFRAFSPLLAAISTAAAVLLLSHEVFSDISRSLEYAGTLSKTQALAELLFSQHGKLAVQVVESKQYIDACVHYSWTASVITTDMKVKDVVLVETDTGTLSREQVVNSLHAGLAKLVLRKANKHVELDVPKE